MNQQQQQQYRRNCRIHFYYNFYYIRVSEREKEQLIAIILSQYEIECAVHKLHIGLIKP